MGRHWLIIAGLTACGSPSEPVDAGAPKTYSVETLDLNTTTRSPPEWIIRLTSAGNRVFGTTLYDVFVSDGTNTGTHYVPHPGTRWYAFGITDLQVGADGFAYFIVDDGDWGRELWRTDGTQSSRLTDCNPGAGHTFGFYGIANHPFALLDGGVFVGCPDRPFRLDLATGALDPLSDVALRPDDFQAVAGHVYFTAEQSDGGRAPYVTDGTRAGTRRIADFNFQDLEVAEANGQVFFAAQSDQSLYALEANGAVREVKHLATPYRGAHALTSAGGLLFFVGPIDTLYAEAFWVSDGTSAGTHPVTDGGGRLMYSPWGVSTPYPGPPSPLVIGDDVIFATTDRLWTTDGGEAVPLAVPQECPLVGYQPYLGLAGTRVVFHGGTQGGVCSSEGLLAPDLGDTVFASIGSDVLAAGWGGLWRTDGTRGGTTELTSPVQQATASSFPQSLSPRDGEVVFSAAADGGPRHLFSFGDAGVTLLSPLTTDYVIPTSFGLFAATRDELVRIDGASAGVLSSVALFFPRFEVFGDRLFFSSCTFGTSTQLLYVTDGTTARTRFLGTLPSDYCRDPDLAGEPGDVFFSSDRDLLWTDGQRVERIDVPVDPSAYREGEAFSLGNSTVWWPLSDGLRRIQRLDAGSYDVRMASEAPRNVTAVFEWRGARYVAADELHRFDSDGGQVQLTDNFGGQGSTGPGSFVAAGEDLFFSAVDRATGRELWKTRGTPETTERVADVSVGVASGFVGKGLWLEPEQVLVFAGAEPGSGIELWRSDGTATGTRRVIDLVPGPGSSDPTDFARVGDWLYFSATDPATGTEVRRIPVEAVLVHDPPAPIEPPRRGCETSPGALVLALLLALTRRR